MVVCIFIANSFNYVYRLTIKKASNWLEGWFLAFVSLVVIFVTLILLDSGKLNNYNLIFAGKGYKLSNSDITNIFKSNIEEVINTYNEYLVVDFIDFVKEPDRWKLEEKESNLYLRLKLKYVPLEKTITISTNAPDTYWLKGNYYKDGFYVIPINTTLNKKELIENFRKFKRIYEIKYIRKP